MEPATPQQAREGIPRWLRTMLVLLLLLALTLAAGLFYVRRQLAPTSTTSIPVEFEVLPGWGASRIASELETEGLVRHARIFSVWLRLNELDRNLGEGLYDLDANMSAQQIGMALAAGGRPRVVRVVIPEGFRTIDISERIAEAGLGDRATFQSLMASPAELQPDYVPQEVGLEGFLFPASYDLRVKSTPQEVIQVMITRFEQELNEGTRAALEALDLTTFEWVTLASIVQSEAGSSEEMPIIAGVFLNRLDRGMLLQSDPTVAYGLGKNLPELDVFAGDFEKDHPWNTYTRLALPAGPISNPGSDALQAVLHAIRQNEDGQDYLYFLHGFEDGEPVFRPNLSLADHNRDVQRFLR